MKTTRYGIRRRIEWVEQVVHGRGDNVQWGVAVRRSGTYAVRVYMDNPHESTRWSARLYRLANNRVLESEVALLRSLGRGGGS